MTKQFITTLGIYIMASALIWGLVIIGCSYSLKGTGCYDKIQNILVSGVVIHNILIWGPLTVLFKKARENKPSSDSN